MYYGYGLRGLLDPSRPMKVFLSLNTAAAAAAATVSVKRYILDLNFGTNFPTTSDF